MYRPICLIILAQIHDSKTWITFSYVFETSLQKRNVVFLDLKKT